MIRQKRSDTLVSSIEATYGLDLNARSDMTLGNLLRERGFDSLTQFLTACRGHLTYHASPRRVFLSFHWEDLAQVRGFRLMMESDRVNLDISGEENRSPVRSKQSSYIKQALRTRIGAAEVVICMIGSATAWRDWVDWELRTAVECSKGVCGVRLKGSRGRTPAILSEIGAPVVGWDLSGIRSAIECAAARRS